MRDEPRTAGAEFRMAAAGPAMSLALAALFAVLSRMDALPLLSIPSEWLAFWWVRAASPAAGSPSAASLTAAIAASWIWLLRFQSLRSNR